MVMMREPQWSPERLKRRPPRAATTSFLLVMLLAVQLLAWAVLVTALLMAMVAACPRGASGTLVAVMAMATASAVCTRGPNETKTATTGTLRKIVSSRWSWASRSRAVRGPVGTRDPSAACPRRPALGLWGTMVSRAGMRLAARAAAS